MQSVVVPRCRATAEALQITVGHILGDAGSPYLTGLVRPGGWWGSREGLHLEAQWLPGGPGRPHLSPLQISSALRAGRPDTYLQRFLSLQQSFLCCAFVVALGGGCFLLTALYLERDQAQAQKPGTGTLLLCTHAGLRADPIGAKSTGHPLNLLIYPFIHLLIHAHVIVTPLLCAGQDCRSWGVNIKSKPM